MRLKRLRIFLFTSPQRIPTAFPESNSMPLTGSRNMEKLSDRKIEKHSSVLFDSIGCKLNKYEIEVMRSQAEELGLVPLFQQPGRDPKANVLVINTCSVTNQASKDSRRKIRSFRKHNPDSYLVVTGCYSQTDLEDVKKLGVDLILSNHEKESFFEKIQADIPLASDRDEVL